MTNTPALVQVSGLSKRFSGVQAVSDVSLVFEAGSIHALAGENGAGKSTLIKPLCGAYLPDQGEMFLGGEPYMPRSPFDAMQKGIRVVHQELLMLDELSVAENLLFDHLPRSSLGFLNRKVLVQKARTLLEWVGLSDLDPERKVTGLGMAQRQLIEIAKALSSQCRLLIMDEPTATLTSRETERLFDIVRNLRDQGVGLVFVSHHLQELFELCDTVTVLRNGKKVATDQIAHTTPKALVQKMVGHEVMALEERQAPLTQSTPALEVRDFRFQGQMRGEGLNFSLFPGEIVGLAGLVGSGRTETARAIFGADPSLGGHIFCAGKEVQIKTPKDALKNGICLVTEDRKDEGLLLDMPIATNLSLARLKECSNAGWLNDRQEAVDAQKIVDRLQIRLSHLKQSPRELSGGNQQKVVLGKWLLKDPDVLILDEPTRGVDVGAKAEIHRILQTLADKGKALLVISSDLPELLALADRILVLSRGKLAGEVARDDFSEEKILALAYSEYMTPEKFS